jgi:hypothetical protein
MFAKRREEARSGCHDGIAQPLSLVVAGVVTATYGVVTATYGVVTATYGVEAAFLASGAILLMAIIVGLSSRELRRG